MEENIAQKIYSEHQKRIRFYALIACVVSLIIWLSYIIFSENPRLKLIPDAKRAISIISEYEKHQIEWTQANAPKIKAVNEQLRLLLNEFSMTETNWDINNHSIISAGYSDLGPEVAYTLDAMEVVVSIPPTRFTLKSLVFQWMDDIRSYYLQAGSSDMELNNMYRAYLATLLKPDWLVPVASFCYPRVYIYWDPTSLSNIDWAPSSGNTYFNELQRDIPFLTQFSTIIEKKPGQLRTLRDIRQMAEELISLQPSPKLPFFNENITGKLAFTFTPLFLLLTMHLLYLSIHFLMNESEEVKSLRGTGINLFGILYLALPNTKYLRSYFRVINDAIAKCIILIPMSTAWAIIDINIRLQWYSPITFVLLIVLPYVPILLYTFLILKILSRTWVPYPEQSAGWDS